MSVLQRSRRRSLSILLGDQARPCRGCGVELGRGGSKHAYCEDCRAQECPECRRYAGRHGRACLYTKRTRRPALETIYDRVTGDDVLDLYVTHGPAAVRLASRVLRVRDAEDIVHDVMVYLLERRRYLTQVPGRAYLFTAVRHAALRSFGRYWSRMVLVPTPEELQSAERLLEPDELENLP